jgi:hypothetical protein
MTVSPDTEAAAAYLEAEADRVKSGSGLTVPEGELSFAAHRLRACAANLRAGLHLPDPSEGMDHG